ncbi:MAG: Dihydrofolate synthase @ Folylpolyglutamate synthase [uncultured Thermomicrobiales bacterium]|uniref:Dihydrofolate synthase/folylpolyglutamate synthase n=1 Tax=uncultured Thermomicrobiales bacterium TaxID=1645740 RepID=A0A6J4U111_9BACT|nr:MAG: Dihydrofolate synthase @ Folylpolyglutamate synthase [uncultured Thermomicrobiales bacterium]
MIPSDPYRAALARIYDRSLAGRGFISDPLAGDAAARLGLRRMAALLERLDRPQDRYGIVHVAGSKGKGSVCAFVAAMLGATGYRVGTTTSPHLHSYRERIVVDGAPADEATFAALVERVAGAAEVVEAAEPGLGRVNAFELTVAMALDRFAAVGCNLAVVEVGIGGTLDATNVVAPLAAAITPIELEHTAVLGETLAEIAANKAGIIEPGRPVVVSPQTPEALRVIENAARDRGSPLLLAGRDWTWSGTWRNFALDGSWGIDDGLRLAMPGRHQVENAGVAVAAVRALEAFGFPAGPAAVRRALAAAALPGRFERVAVGEATVVLDGAHTAAAAAVLAETVEQEYPARETVLVFGTFSDKDPAPMLAALRSMPGPLVATRPAGPRAASPDAVATIARVHGRTVSTARTVAEAVERGLGLAGLHGLVVVTGALATVAEARLALGLAVADPPPGDQ